MRDRPAPSLNSTGGGNPLFVLNTAAGGASSRLSLLFSPNPDDGNMNYNMPSVGGMASMGQEAAMSSFTLKALEYGIVTTGLSWAESMALATVAPIVSNIAGFQFAAVILQVLKNTMQYGLIKII